MPLRRAAGPALRHARQVAGEAVRAVAAGVAAACAGLAYRRQELAVVGLLAASVVGGLVVDLWRRRAPALFERLEAEPPRLAPIRARPAGAASPAPPRGRPPGARAFPPAAPSAERPLDLNLATAHELTRLPGVGPRLAARIVARREALGGRFAAPDDLAAVRGIGRRRAAELRPLVRVGAAAEASGPAAAEPP